MGIDVTISSAQCPIGTTFRTDFLCMTSNVWVHDQGWDWRSKYGTPLECNSFL